MRLNSNTGQLVVAIGLMANLIEIQGQHVKNVDHPFRMTE